jgi:PAS domain S-box-containing protein
MQIDMSNFFSSCNQSDKKLTYKDGTPEALPPDAEARFREIILASPMGVHMYRLEGPGTLLFDGFNPAAEHILGIDHLERFGKPIEEAFPDLQHAGLAHRYREVARTGEPWLSEDVFYRSTARQATLRVHAFPAGTGRMAAMFLDVSEQHRTLIELRDSEQRYRILMDSAPIPILIHCDEEIVFSNQEANRVFGAGVLKNLNSTSYWDYVHPEEIEFMRERIRFVHQIAGQHPQREGRFIRADGTVLHMLVIATPVRYNRRQGVQVVFLDLTARKRAEEERIRMETRLQQSQKMESLGILAGGIAHDFNNLLTGVLGNLDLARHELAPQSGALPFLRTIETAARRAAELCQQMLAYSGKGRLVVADVCLNDVVSEMLALLKASIAGSTRLVYNLSRGLPLIRADSTQLRQLIMNLITNASDAQGNTEGSIYIETGADRFAAEDLRNDYFQTDLKDGQYVFLCVRDEGCGMNDVTLRKMFDPFFTTKPSGRGLGLAAALGIVKGHRGTIKFKSVLGKGTEFTVFFPVSAEASSRQHVPARSGSPELFEGRGTLLLADDEGVLRSLGQALLERMGFGVVAASDGAETVAAVRRDPNRYSCVILDMSMPGPDATSTLKELRAIREDLPIVLTSGYAESDVAPKFAWAGLAAFLQKPYQSHDLTAVLRTALGPALEAACKEAGINKEALSGNGVEAAKASARSSEETAVRE